MSGQGGRSAAARLAAWAALVAAAVVFVTLAVVAVRNLVAVVLLLAGLGAAGAAGWIFATRRGRARRLAFMGAAGAVAGGVAVLLAYDLIGELVLLVAAGLVYAAAGRQAMAVPPATAPSPAASPPRARANAILFLNPRSGGGKVVTFDLVNEARRRGIETVLLEPGDDLAEMANTAAESAEALGVAGGDGTQALVAEVAMLHELPFVCIPAGTRNHLALDLGLDVDDVVGALDAFAANRERRVDLAFVNDRIFVNNVSLGLYAQIVQSAAYRDAKRETVEEMLPDLLGPDATPFDLEFVGPDGRAHQTADVVLVSNNPYDLGRLGGGGGARPRLDSGTLGIVAVTIDNPGDAARMVTLGAARQLSRFEGWLEWAAPSFDVRSDAAVVAGIDGEAALLDPPLHFRVAPGALTVLLPPGASGRSPAAARPALAGSSLRELWHVGTGAR